MVLTARPSLANPQSYLHNWVDDRSQEQEQEPKLFGNDIQHSEANDCLTTQFYACCVCVLKNICQQLSTLGPPKLEKNGLDIELRILQEELARLYLCGDGFADGEMGTILDHAIELRDNLLEILCEIGTLLLDDFQISQDEDWDDLSSFIQQAKGLIAVDPEDEVFDSDDEDDSESVNEDQDESDSVSSDGNDPDSVKNNHTSSHALRSHIQMIMDLIPTIESTIEHQKIVRLRHLRANSSKFQASCPAQIYISLVQDRFPNASEKLQERLGEANWQRHVNIRRRMEQVQGRRRDNANEKATGTGSLFHDSGIDITTGSHSQYAQTETSHTSFMLSIAGTEKGHVRVPPTPIEVGDGKPFYCQLCGIMQTEIRNRIDWKRHVFQDVRPYICTFPDCKDELRQFSTRQAWADHEFNEHRMHRVWSCAECHAESSTSQDWLDHVRDRHQQQFSESLASKASAAACRKIYNPIEKEKCLLCDKYPSNTRRALVAHIGKHMEEVAMMALTKPHLDNSGDTTESDVSNCDIDGLTNGNSQSEHAGSEKLAHSPPRIICTHPGCNSSFERSFDLKRHLETHFPSEPLDCPYAEVTKCGRAGQRTATNKGGFTRKDHLMAHVRREHSQWKAGVEPDTAKKHGPKVL